MKTVSVIGTPVACTDYRGALDWIIAAAQRGDRAYAVEAANTHVVSLAKSDQNFGERMSRFDLVVPDGMPLVWSINRKLPAGEKLSDRVYGPNLMLKCIEESCGRTDLRHFLLGGAESTLEKLVDRFDSEYPDASIAGTYSPPFGDWPEDEFDRISEKIEASKANLIWVGLGCPKQEHWIAKHKDKLPHGVYFGIGAAFAFHAGEVRQAPQWMQDNGLEWAFRLAAEPRRLFKRYLVNNFRFLWYLTISK